MTVVGNDLICDRCNTWLRIPSAFLRSAPSIRAFGAKKGWVARSGKDFCIACQGHEPQADPRRMPR